MRRVVLACALLFGGMLAASPLLTRSAIAHPFETDLYSLRTMVKIADSGQMTALVVLEVPMQVVLGGLDVQEGDSQRKQQKALEDWNTSTWDKMAEGLTLTVDGEPVKGTWRPIEHPTNGKGAEGFFVYLVGFDLQQELPKEGYVLRIENRSYPDKPMVYSGSATAQGPWELVRDSSRDALGDQVDTPLSNPGRWSKDPAMRDIEIEVRPKG